MVVIILAAGYATRLYPLTKDKPKALLDIGSRPLVDHLIDKISSLKDIKKIILVTNHRFTGQFESWASRQEKKGDIHVLDDRTTSNENRLGAIGDLQFSIDQYQVQDDIIVLASDNLFDGDLKDFVLFANSKKDSGCIGVHDLKDPSIGAKRYGMIRTDAESRILSIDEKPEHPQSSLASMGIYFFPQSSLKFIKEYLASGAKQDAPGFYATWLLAKMQMYAFSFPGRWYDIGSVEQLEEARTSYSLKD